MDLIKNLEPLTRSAFESKSVGSDNALRRLDPGDRMMLFVYLYVFEERSLDPGEASWKSTKMSNLQRLSRKVLAMPRSLRPRFLMAHGN